MVFLARNVGFRLFLVLETLEQPKISCLKPKISQVAQHDLRAFNLSLLSMLLIKNKCHATAVAKQKM